MSSSHAAHAAQSTSPVARYTNTPAELDWFVHDRFGLFIHWGLYALPARHEWVKHRERMTDEHYERYFRHFDPDLFDPTAWAKAARDAGMKYFVLTSKHHEGFCLWDTDFTDYKATNTPIGRDLLAGVTLAFRNEGLRVGYYHSVIDWHHPHYTIDRVHPQRDDAAARAGNQQRDMERYRHYLHGQVGELLTRYGHIDLLWFDFSFPGEDGKGAADWQSQMLIDVIRELQPHVIINNRLDVPQDLWTPEQTQPREWLRVDDTLVTWEACQTLNGSWGYDRDNLDWKPVDMLLRMLVDTVSKGGNLLLNVGPNGRGEFEPRALDTLAGIGRWMRLHNRSIYGCGQSEFTAPADCRLTQNGNRLYLHLFAYPFGAVHLEGLSDRVDYAQFLGDASEVRFTPWNRGAKRHDGPEDVVTLHLPVQPPDECLPVIEIFLKDA